MITSTGCPPIAGPVKVSVVIPTKNRPADLSRCLVSLSKLDEPPDQIIVIDNGSTSETTSVLESFPSVEVVVEPIPCLPRLFNLGVGKAKCPILAFLNDDTAVDPGYIRDIRRWFNDLPDAAAIGGPTRDIALRRLGRLNARGSVLLALYDRFLLQGRLHEYRVLTPWAAFSIGTSVPSAPRKVGMLTVTNMAIRKDVLEQVGGFDEDYRFANFDGDLFLRLQTKGYPMYSVPDAGVDHFVNPRGSTRSPYFLSRDCAVWYAKVRPRNAREKLLLELNKLSQIAFWADTSRETGLSTFVLALKGYLDGAGYMSRTEHRATSS